MTRKPTTGVCRWCGCTDDRACQSGCFWVDDALTRCSACVAKAVGDSCEEDHLCRLVIDVPALLDRLELGELDFAAVDLLQVALIEGMATAACQQLFAHAQRL